MWDFGVRGVELGRGDESGCGGKREFEKGRGMG